MLFAIEIMILIKGVILSLKLSIFIYLVFLLAYFVSANDAQPCVNNDTS